MTPFYNYGANSYPTRIALEFDIPRLLGAAGVAAIYEEVSMIRVILSWGLLALGISVLPVASQGGSFFDGSGGQMPEIKIAKSSPAPQPRFVRSNADLYYFTPQEAQEALQLLENQDTPTTQGYVFEPNVPANIQQQMREDLAFIDGIKGQTATPLHKSIFGLVDGPSYTKFFNDRVTAIGMNSCGGGSGVACVIPIKGATKMWLTQNFVKLSHPQVARMMIVFHEARHTEKKNGFWSHATCPTPFLDANGKEVKSIWTGAKLAGEAACDDTPLGAYGSSTIMLKNISKHCANCTDKVKMDSGLYADDHLMRITDEVAKKEMQEDFEQ